MPEYTLTAQSPLNGAEETIGDVKIAEQRFEIVSIAVPQGGGDRLSAALDRAFGLRLPVAGGSVRSADGSLNLLWTAPDQCLLLAGDRSIDFDREAEAALDGAGYITLQSDNWAVIALSGGDCRRVLERLTMIDTGAEQFPVGSVARSLMRHLGVILTRTGDDSYLLLSAASSALSFWEDVRHAAQAVAALKALTSGERARAAPPH